LNISSRRLSLEASWRPLGRGVLAGVSGGLAPWLRDDSSLTRRVVRACEGQFSVEVIRQSHARPLPSERRLLGTSPREQVLVREVELRCQGCPWVFARTLIPAASLSGEARRLSVLGSRPLGAVLFADPRTERRRIEIGRLGPRHPLFARAVGNLDHGPRCLWGRRTLFVYAGRSLLVNEIFLPGIPRVRPQAALTP
jgi:chorismate--pyruvate lyase